MSHAINDEALDTIFRAARTHRQWQDKPVSSALLMAIYDLMRWGPTGANCARRALYSSSRLRPRKSCGPISMPAIVHKTMSAPATAILRL